MLLKKDFVKVMPLGLNEVTVASYGEVEAETKVLADGTAKNFSAFVYINLVTDDGATAQVRFYDDEGEMTRLSASLNAILMQLSGQIKATDFGEVLELLKTSKNKFKVVLKQVADKGDTDKLYTNYYFDRNTISNYSRRAR